MVYDFRSTDLLIAPTINVTQTNNGNCNKFPLDTIVKQRVWDMWQYCESMITQGYTSIVLRDGDFTYSYFLWFEDVLGNPLQIQKPMRDLAHLRATGILSGHFYR